MDTKFPVGGMPAALAAGAARNNARAAQASQEHDLMLNMKTSLGWTARAPCAGPHRTVRDFTKVSGNFALRSKHFGWGERSIRGGLVRIDARARPATTTLQEDV